MLRDAYATGAKDAQMSCARSLWYLYFVHGEGISAGDETRLPYQVRGFSMSAYYRAGEPSQASPARLA